MSTSISSQPVPDKHPRNSRWATGLIMFAGVVMMVAGVWHALAGVGALVNDEVYVATPPQHPPPTTSSALPIMPSG
jgi:hypothetical protein